MYIGHIYWTICAYTHIIHYIKIEMVRLQCEHTYDICIFVHSCRNYAQIYTALCSMHMCYTYTVICKKLSNHHWHNLGMCISQRWIQDTCIHNLDHTWIHLPMPRREFCPAYFYSKWNEATFTYIRESRPPCPIFQLVHRLHYLEICI